MHSRFFFLHISCQPKLPSQVSKTSHEASLPLVCGFSCTAPGSVQHACRAEMRHACSNAHYGYGGYDRLATPSMSLPNWRPLPNSWRYRRHRNPRASLGRLYRLVRSLRHEISSKANCAISSYFVFFLSSYEVLSYLQRNIVIIRGSSGGDSLKRIKR